MKRILLLVPCLALSAFGTYHHHWNAGQRARDESIAHDPLAAYNYRDGRLEAEADYARGDKRLLVLGEPPAEAAEYRNLLEHVYRVHLEAIACEAPTRELQRYVAAYNEVMEQHIASDFGAGSITDLHDLALRRHQLGERIRQYVPPL